MLNMMICETESILVQHHLLVEVADTFKLRAHLDTTSGATSDSELPSESTRPDTVT